MTFKINNLIRPHQSYSLVLPLVPWPISVFSIQGKERINQPWRYEIIFTSSQKNIPTELVLCQEATLNFRVPSFLSVLAQDELENIHTDRNFIGVITEFSLIKDNKEEAQYCVVLMPKLALLSKHTRCAIYQYKSVIEVAEAVLKRHDFLGSDYRFELKESYPMREFITQWQETDLAFLERILSDVGIWIRFEYHERTHRDCIIVSDNMQGHLKPRHLIYRASTGLEDGQILSVWNVQMHSRIVESGVKVNDYNYCEAKTSLLCQVNTDPKNSMTYGWDYRCNEYYQQKGSNECPESGLWYAVRRHQACLTKQYLIRGKSNDYTLSAGQHLYLDENPLGSEIKEGILILSVSACGNRTEAFEVEFTGIPYDLSRPYRPTVFPRPEIHGTLPAIITSPDNDTYGYLDIQGRYRVKFGFDLTRWEKGHESLWLRLAKLYSGNEYGFHFPLITGTEVAVAFVGGNPDRPYIACAMHNSIQPDLVTIQNKYRNVIRTPANNKLRMDDKRGEEHIKIATEFAKTQLNLGHLVDSKKGKRGLGFELRTDHHGAIAANKGIYLTTDEAKPNIRVQRDMPCVQVTLDNALEVAKGLETAAEIAGAHKADVQSQTQLKIKLMQLKQNAMVAYGKAGIALVSDKNIQLSGGKNNTITAERDVNMSIRRKIVLSTKEALSFLAQKSGLKLFSNRGKVEIAAQTDAVSLHAQHDLIIESTDGKMTLPAAKEILLMSGGSYIKITEMGIELGTQGNVMLKSAGMEKLGPSSIGVKHSKDMEK